MFAKTARPRPRRGCCAPCWLRFERGARQAAGERGGGGHTMGKGQRRPVLNVSFAPQHLLRTEISRGWLDSDFSPLQVPVAGVCLSARPRLSCCLRVAYPAPRIDPARPRSPFARPLMIPGVGVACLSRITAAAKGGCPPVCPHGCSQFPQRGLGMTLLRTTLLPCPACPCNLNAVTLAEVILLACQLATQPMMTTVSPYPLV